YEERGNFIYVYTAKQLAEIRAAARELKTVIITLSYVTAADAKVLIEPALSKDGTIAMSPAAAVGIPASETETGGNSLAGSDVLVVRDYAENIKRVQELVKALDVKPDQVLIETTILSANLTEDTDLGINVSALHGIDFENRAGAISTTCRPWSVMNSKAYASSWPKTGARINGSSASCFVRPAPKWKWPPMGGPPSTRPKPASST
ncbi:hypothetical protein LCGC14_2532040, partial [marine sediment metagenome]